jgi:CRISPR/Cas system Type II protein with McrA/HNH and RuvC-like nuclease domain
MDTHICKICDSELPIDRFTVDKSGYVRKMCKPCFNEYQRNRRHGIQSTREIEEKKQKKLEKRDLNFLNQLNNLQKSLDKLIEKNIKLDLIELKGQMDDEEIQGYEERIKRIGESLNTIIISLH